MYTVSLNVYRAGTSSSRARARDTIIIIVSQCAPSVTITSQSHARAPPRKRMRIILFYYVHRRQQSSLATQYVLLYCVLHHRVVPPRLPPPDLNGIFTVARFFIIVGERHPPPCTLGGLKLYVVKNSLPDTTLTCNFFFFYLPV